MARGPGMQAVFVCGGKGSRLRPQHAGPKSLTPVAGATLLARLVSRFAPLHSSRRPPVVIVSSDDAETPQAVAPLLPGAHIVYQPWPDGVANALLLSQPFLDEEVIVTLGDVFLDGPLTLAPAPALFLWREAPPADTRNNFGVALTADGLVSGVIEKPDDDRRLACGMGVYLLTRSAIAAFRDAPIDVRTGERGITDGIQAAIEAGVRFRAIPFSGYYSNVNSPRDIAAIERTVAPSLS
jgi:dTDP-glucose pyrophosphorylase